MHESILHPSIQLNDFQFAVDGGGNAARARLKPGDQVLYTTSFFGDELWPADKLGFTKTAIQAKPDSIYFVFNRFSNPSRKVNVWSDMLKEARSAISLGVDSDPQNFNNHITSIT
ncbi:hypothetical protein GmHk_05G013461 [Glycine max]|nr:hypothetical protein GmHk_05G013461 [Glycine max]